MDIFQRLREARAPFATSKDRDQARVHNACLDAEQEIERLHAAGKVLASIFEDDAESDNLQFVSWSTTTYGELRAAVAVFDPEQKGPGA